MKTSVFAGAALVAASVVLARPTAQESVFRVKSDLVSVYATVTDAEQRLVTGLAQTDFAIYDNGKKQTLSAFSNGQAPFTAVVMLDRSGSMASHAAVVRAAATAFVQNLMPGDRIRIGSFTDQVVIEPEGFTSNRDELERLLGAPPSLTSRGSSVWVAIDRSITALLPEPGRRVVVAMTDGQDAPGRGVGVTHLDDLVHRLRVDEVMVYTIGFTPDDTARGSGGRGPGRIVFPPPARRPAAAPDPGLRRLAEESGGGYFPLDESGGLEAKFLRVAEELHHQYWLGFAPRVLDGEIHKIEVKVGRPGLIVRARKAYNASAR